MWQEIRSRKEKEAFRGLDEEQKLTVLNDILAKSEHLVFLGGAGVSTESGIPDFRSKDGLYRKKGGNYRGFTPEYLLSSDCLSRQPKLFFSYFREKLDCRHALPNDAHRKLFELESKGRLDGVITQNIDGLHQKAGSRTVKEIHGSALRSYCTGCRREYGEDFIFENTEPIPHCPICGKMVRPAVTLYGELLPQPAYEEALALIRYADCLIIGGTSLAVGSAAQLAHLFHGDRLIIINKGKTKLEGKADLVFHDSIGKIMNAIEV